MRIPAIEFLAATERCSAVFVLGSAILFSATNCEKSNSLPSTPAHVTPGWTGYGHLLIRDDPGGDDSILLRHLRAEQFGTWAQNGGSGAEFGGTIYRYSPASGTLTVAPAGQWNSSTTPIVDCARSTLARLYGQSKTIVHDLQTDTVLLNGTTIETQGKTVLHAAVDASLSLVAVLSTDGPLRSGPLWAFGARKASGPRYHQVINLHDGALVGRPVVLADASSEHSLQVCWSPDGGSVVYHDDNGRLLWVIPANQGSDAPK